MVLQPHTCRNTYGLGYSPFARHYLGNHYLFSIPTGTKMFQFPAFASIVRWIISLQDIGLSHSEIRGSKVICTYPQLIAAYHVLHRLREPRHPPCALTYFLSYRSRMVDIYFQLLTLLFFGHIMSKNGVSIIKTIIKTEWRITDSNR